MDTFLFVAKIYLAKYRVGSGRPPIAMDAHSEEE
jgi:hypothetical protein